MFKTILEGYGEFSKNLSAADKELFSRLSEGQSPEALLITCSDSRIVPQLFTHTGPGDIFMVRNAGNIIPPCGHKGISPGDQSEMASVEYAVKHLGVRHIIVCGHSDCGAMKALQSGVDQEGTPHLYHWLNHAQDTLENFKAEASSEWDEVSQLSQFNVIRQLEHLKNYKFIRERLEKDELTLHGWFFNISSASLYLYDEKQQNFFSLLEEE
mgnify:CR=1 FL=1